MTQEPVSEALKLWRRFAGWPGGRWLFSRLVTLRAPFFATISPRIIELRPGYCEAAMRKRRRITNHLGTVHAVAMCNVAELVGGLMTDVTVPPSCRWIPKGMTVRYLRKGETDLMAVAELEQLPEIGDGAEVLVPVKVSDSRGDVVFEADITMWVTPKRRQQRPSVAS